MNLRRWAISLLAVGGLLTAYPTWGAEEVRQGQTIDRDGVLIEAPKVPQLVEELREARRSVEQLSVLREAVTAQEAQVTTLAAQVKTLEDANARLNAALKLAEEIESLRQKQRDLATTVFERYDRALKQADAALDRAEARISGLEQRAFWSQVLSIIGPIALFVLLAL